MRWALSWWCGTRYTSTQEVPTARFRERFSSPFHPRPQAASPTTCISLPSSDPRPWKWPMETDQAFVPVPASCLETQQCRLFDQDCRALFATCTRNNSTSVSTRVEISTITTDRQQAQRLEMKQSAGKSDVDRALIYSGRMLVNLMAI